MSQNENNTFKSTELSLMLRLEVFSQIKEVSGNEKGQPHFVSSESARESSTLADGKRDDPIALGLTEQVRLAR